MTAKSEPTQNHLLAALSSEAQDRLFPHLELVPLSLGAVVSQSGERVQHIYFPTDSIVSMHYMLESGASSAVSLVGNEGLVGVALFLADGYTLYGSAVERAGFAYRLSAPRAKGEFDRYGELFALVLRCGRTLMTQVSQTVVCNRHHSIFHRLCRWLLLFMDRMEDDQLIMTHETISNMLGVRREGVTEAALELQRLGVITYRRGIIKVLDRPKLESLCCECYSLVGRETDPLPEHLPRRQVITKRESLPTGTLRNRAFAKRPPGPLPIP